PAVSAGGDSFICQEARQPGRLAERWQPGRLPHYPRLPPHWFCGLTSAARADFRCGQNPMPVPQPITRTPWAWVPTLYLAQGLPFAVVNSVSVTMYKSLGVSNADIAFYTAWLYLPWVIKPLWSPD